MSIKLNVSPLLPLTDDFAGSNARNLLLICEHSVWETPTTSRFIIYLFLSFLMHQQPAVSLFISF